MTIGIPYVTECSSIYNASHKDRSTYVEPHADQVYLLDVRLGVMYGYCSCYVDV